jgi:hypothetical protein
VIDRRARLAVEQPRSRIRHVKPAMADHGGTKRDAPLDLPHGRAFKAFVNERFGQHAFDKEQECQTTDCVEAAFHCILLQWKRIHRRWSQPRQ